MNDPLVTIITPSYNQSQYIEKTIYSVLNQTYKNIQYIIVDGNSKDNTSEILDNYKNIENVTIIIEKDNGQSDAINKGFKLAKGNLVGWINSDDVLKLDCVENIVKTYYDNPDAAIFYGGLDLIDEDDNYIKTINPNKITYDNLLNKCPDVIQPGSFYNMHYVKRVGYLDENIHFTMDYDLWLRLLKIDEAVLVNKVLAEFRLQHESKTMSSGNWKRFWKDIFLIRKTKHNKGYLGRMSLYFLKWMIDTAFTKIFHE